MLVTALAVLAMAAAQDPAAGAKPPLKVDLKLDAAEYVIGEDVQAEVTVTNTGGKDLEIAEPAFEDRSVSFEVTLVAGEGKPARTFTHSASDPSPHLVTRLPLPRITLKPNATAVYRRRIPTLATGRLTVKATYAGGSAAVSSAPVTVKVNPRADGTSKLAAIFTTSQGRFTVELAPAIAPGNVANFVTLARQGFYDDMIFHRVVKGGWIQSGCPNGTGYGGPGYAVKSEAATQKDVQGYHDTGTLAMSKHLKEGYAGSQFFLSLRRIDAFDGKFTIIGRAGEKEFDALHKIGDVAVDRNTDRPQDDVRLNKVTIVVQ